MSFRCPDRTSYWIVAALLFVATASGGSSPPLRVCADPDNLPFSNQRGEGFENRLAELFARDLHTSVAYTWRAQRRGFVRKSFAGAACDVIIGVPAQLTQLLRTAPYYRSTYVFVARRDRHLSVRSFDDPRLRTLRVGVQVIGDDGADTPPAIALARRGMITNVRSFVVPDDRGANGIEPRIIEAVARREIDVAVAWGPFAGYWAHRSRVSLALDPVLAPADLAFLPFTFDIALGVRPGDANLRARLDSALSRRHRDIERILDAYGVPHAPPSGGSPAS
jgi:mxaJ protein